MVRAIFVLLVITSCSTGHINEFGIYVPNSPKYKLKDRKGDSIPKELDTLNLYKYYGYYNEKGLLVKDTLDNKNWKIYDKYCEKGRFYTFGAEKLTENILNPNHANKGYYIFDKKNRRIKSEIFTNGNGGQFVIIKYRLSKKGDTLLSIEGKKNYSVHIKEKIPSNWKRYKPDW